MFITKYVNNQLHNSFVTLEYPQGECVEIVGIPTLMLIHELDEPFCKFEDKVAVKINDKFTESFYCVGSQGHTKVKLSHRKNCQQLMKVKKNLTN